MIAQLFATPVDGGDDGLSDAQRQTLVDYLIGLRQSDRGVTRSNRGGWHSAGNLLAPPHPPYAFLREAILRSLMRYIGEVFGHAGEASLSVTSWAVVNGAGEFNVPHNHPGYWLSGVLYLQVPATSTGGELVLLDPRFNVNAFEGTQEMRAPWMNPSTRIQPQTGQVIVFPAWLSHYVEPFEADDPSSLRIVIAFNARPG